MSSHSGEPLILTTKLYPPVARTELVHRARLTERLNAGLARPLTLVSAPAGSGKTTLVADWLVDNNAQRLPLAWLALDAAENDPNRFLAHLVAALQTVQPHIGAASLHLLQTNAQVPVRSALLHLINELAAELSPCVLALDDYHVIESQEVHALVETLIANQPNALRLLILTRHEPPLPLARLRARGELSELRAGELRFTRTELETLLADKFGTQFSLAELDALEQRTEGWAAGVQLAALALDGAGSEHRPAAITGSSSAIFDYLASEALERLPQQLQRFLLRSSVVERLCAPLLDFMLEETDSQQHIEELERRNLFIIPLDAERRWYRYHHLFGEFLRTRLEREVPSSSAQLLERASEWFDLHGFVDEAISSALKSESFERAAALIETAAVDLLQRGEFTTFNGWISALPDTIMRDRPALLVCHAWSTRSTGQVAFAEQRVREIECWTGYAITDDTAFALPPARRHWLAQAALLVATSADAAGQTDRAMDLYKRSYTLLEDDESPFGKMSRPVVELCIGMGMFDAGEDAEQAERFFRNAVEGGRAAGNTFAVLVGSQQLGRLLISQGRMSDALAAFRNGLTYFDTPFTTRLAIIAQIHVEIADVYRERGDFDEAYRHLNAALGLPDLSGGASVEIAGPVVRARCLTAQGDYEAAHADLHQALAAVAAGTDLAQPLTDLPSAAQARLWIVEGRLREATAWAEQAGDLANASGPELLSRAFAALTLVRVWISINQPQSTLTLLERLHNEAESSSRYGQLLEIDVLHAIAADAAGDERTAFDALSSALRRAEASGYFRSLVDEGAALARLLQRWIAHREPHNPAVSVTFLGRLTDALGIDLPLPRKRSAYSTPQNLSEPLSDRELDVLRLLALGHSNREIANQLFITTGTVKRHSHNIFRKLGARNRVEAGLRGRELGLV